MKETNTKINELLTYTVQRPDTENIIISLLAALGFSLIMYFAYRLSRDKSEYKTNFAVTLISLALLSTVLMDLVQSNIALSLGMLGSLSIARFRIDLKDPRDIGFIFWAMAIGLAASTKTYIIALAGSAVLALCMILSGRLGAKAREMLLVVRGSRTDLDSIGSLIDKDCFRSRVKAKNIMSDSFELVYEVSISARNSNGLIGRLFNLGGIDTVNLLAEAKNN